MDDKGLAPWRSASITEGMGACCEEGLVANVTSPCGELFAPPVGREKKLSAGTYTSELKCPQAQGKGELASETCGDVCAWAGGGGSA